MILPTSRGIDVGPALNFRIALAATHTATADSAVAGLTYTVPGAGAGKWLIRLVADAILDTAGQVLLGVLTINGTAQANDLILAGAVGSRATITQTWTVDLAEGDVLTIRAQSVGGTAAGRFVATHTVFSGERQGLVPRADVSVVMLTPAGGWTVYSGGTYSEAGGIRLTRNADGLVTFRGAVTNTFAGNAEGSVVLTVPVGYRPPHYLIPLQAWQSGTYSPYVQPDGTVVFRGVAPAGTAAAGSWWSLTGINYYTT
jgi:hypothetical protein